MDFHRISATEAHEKINARDLIILDIRDEESFLAGRIPKALRITPENFKALVNTLDKQKPTLVYCYHGFSSLQAARALANEGMLEIMSLDGGFEGWKKAFPAWVEEGVGKSV